jgi:hypothetical protein
MKRRIERSLLDAQCVIRDLLNARGDAVHVLWLATQRLQNKKIERPLERIWLLCFSNIPRTLGYCLVEAMSRSRFWWNSGCECRVQRPSLLLMVPNFVLTKWERASA